MSARPSLGFLIAENRARLRVSCVLDPATAPCERRQVVRDLQRAADDLAVLVLRELITEIESGRRHNTRARAPRGRR